LFELLELDNHDNQSLRPHPAHSNTFEPLTNGASMQRSLQVMQDLFAQLVRPADLRDAS
jgi:hypothetical protein